ncbi:MAG TPA: hypothetical protein VN704_11150, partial [Verrucomicrobiae bacterium]|nr:hypothetical protein [Verrucomicrobiae bacterium]
MELEENQANEKVCLKFLDSRRDPVPIICENCATRNFKLHAVTVIMRNDYNSQNIYYLNPGYTKIQPSIGLQESVKITYLCEN